MNRSRVMAAAGSRQAVDYNLYEGMTVRGAPDKVFLRGRLIVDGDRFLGERGTRRYLERKIVSASVIPDA